MDRMKEYLDRTRHDLAAQDKPTNLNLRSASLAVSLVGVGVLIGWLLPTDSRQSVVTAKHAEAKGPNQDPASESSGVRQPEPTGSIISQTQGTPGGLKVETKPDMVEISKFAAASKVRIRYWLKDPSSATFRAVKVFRHPRPEGGYVFCGEVNARNSFGGFTGFERFVASPISAVVESMDPSQFRVGWREFCDPSRFVEDAAWF